MTAIRNIGSGDPFSTSIIKTNNHSVLFRVTDNVGITSNNQGDSSLWEEYLKHAETPSKGGEFFSFSFQTSKEAFNDPAFEMLCDMLDVVTRQIPMEMYGFKKNDGVSTEMRDVAIVEVGKPGGVANYDVRKLASKLGHKLRFFYEFAKSLNCHINLMGHGFRVFREKLANPVVYAAHSIRPIKNEEKLSIPKLKESKILVIGGGGKGSSALKSLLKRLDIPHDTFKFGRECKLSVPHTCNFHSLKECEEEKEVLSRTGVDHRKFSYAFSLSLVKRLIALLAGIGYDYVLFGDKLEKHQIYRTDEGLYPTRNYYQTQFFNNFLNDMGVTSSKVFSPLCNFDQLHILKYAVNSKNRLESCRRTKDGWCGECLECRKTSYLMSLLFEKYQIIEGFESLKESSFFKDKSIYQVLSVFSPPEENVQSSPWVKCDRNFGTCIPMFEEIRKHMAELDISRRRRHPSHLDPAGFEPVINEYLSVWDSSSFVKIWDDFQKVFNMKKD